MEGHRDRAAPAAGSGVRPWHRPGDPACVVGRRRARPPAGEPVRLVVRHDEPVGAVAAVRRGRPGRWNRSGGRRAGRRASRRPVPPPRPAGDGRRAGGAGPGDPMSRTAGDGPDADAQVECRARPAGRAVRSDQAGAAEQRPERRPVAASARPRPAGGPVHPPAARTDGAAPVRRNTSSRPPRWRREVGGREVDPLQHPVDERAELGARPGAGQRAGGRTVVAVGGRRPRRPPPVRPRRRRRGPPRSRQGSPERPRRPP